MTNAALNAPQSTRHGSTVRAVSPVRSQAAFVRALLDELERVAPAGADLTDSVTEQLVEELARLGCRCIEIANVLTASVEAEEKASQDVSRCA